jgi:hypothetical protein
MRMGRPSNLVLTGCALFALGGVLIAWDLAAAQRELAAKMQELQRLNPQGAEEGGFYLQSYTGLSLGTTVAFGLCAIGSLLAGTALIYRFIARRQGPSGRGR